VPHSSSKPVSELLGKWQAGDSEALRALMPLVYADLRHLAHQYLRKERPAHTLQSTALVHEAYLRLTKRKKVHFGRRSDFFAVSAQLMRRILVDHARRRNLKRGAGVQHIALEETAVVGGRQDPDLIALDDAMQGLARLDPRKARVVELRFFGGLSVEETAEVLKISSVTVMRDWSTARAWLYREMSGDTSSAAGGLPGTRS